ncbi:MAG: hypothetical protein ACTSR3_05865 [Candidatus Helarchaeota archaeon]
MANVVRNPLNTMYKNKNKLKKIKTFRIEEDNLFFIKNFVIKKTEFFNRAIRAYINMLTNPKQIMIELKKRFPESWKYINRKKF